MLLKVLYWQTKVINNYQALSNNYHYIHSNYIENIWSKIYCWESRCFLLWGHLLKNSFLLFRVGFLYIMKKTSLTHSSQLLVEGWYDLALSKISHSSSKSNFLSLRLQMCELRVFFWYSLSLKLAWCVLCCSLKAPAVIPTYVLLTRDTVWVTVH